MRARRVMDDGIYDVGREYLVLKSLETGEILGTSTPFGVPSRVVRAVMAWGGWREIAEQEAMVPYFWLGAQAETVHG